MKSVLANLQVAQVAFSAKKNLATNGKEEDILLPRLMTMHVFVFAHDTCCTEKASTNRSVHQIRMSTGKEKTTALSGNTFHIRDESLMSDQWIGRIRATIKDGNCPSRPPMVLREMYGKR